MTSYAEIYKSMKSLKPRELVSKWESRGPEEPRDDNEFRALLDTMKRRQTKRNAAWPSSAVAAFERAGGLYPDQADPEFAVRLFNKREFYESRAISAGLADGTVDPCTSAKVTFNLTPVQRIVSRFLHPSTPYMGLLLFHGVGVGKTCSAVTIAEQFLAVAPANTVFVIVPQALHDNFKKTVFDPSKLVWAGKRWTSATCTSTDYLERLGLLYTPDIDVVTRRVEADRLTRYRVLGYQAFANWIKTQLQQRIPAEGISPEERVRRENDVLRHLFSDKLIIIDEAHNLRDLTEAPVETTGPVTAVAAEETVVEAETKENAGGKALNPFLRRIVLNAEGLRLVLMTATPMYNSAPEIVLLLNYLLLNDTKRESDALRIDELFTRDGDLVPEKQRKLEALARRYVSYMRGENPYTFPLRLRPYDMGPIGETTVETWPSIPATASNEVAFSEEDAAAMNALPLLFTSAVPDSPVDTLTRGATPSQPLDARMQMGNISYPNDLYGTQGFAYFFEPTQIQHKSNRVRVYRPRAPEEFSVDSVFSGDGLRAHAPKLAAVLDRVRSAHGMSFVYSRFVAAGALPMAFALERAGFQRRLADGAIQNLLTDVVPVKPICAFCSHHRSNERHKPGSAYAHDFAPACYVLLTSDEELSPQFARIVQRATQWKDPLGPLGAEVKVIVGSQVASEGLDLKCVREVHVIDAWYHLNRTEQIVGRAIRFCSHTALRDIERRDGVEPMTYNNATIYLHALRIDDSASGTSDGVETADMYAYRLAVSKARRIGAIQRLLKTQAWDCNLEIEAIRFVGLPPRRQIDAQNRERTTMDADGEELDGYAPNDQDYTTYCDFQVCNHTCAKAVDPTAPIDDSTFSIDDARRAVLDKQKIVQRYFAHQVAVPDRLIRDLFADIPWEITAEALRELLDGQRFRFRRPDGVEGFLVKKADYVVFQPLAVVNTDIPLTMRYAPAFQLKRRFATIPDRVLVHEEIDEGDEEGEGEGDEGGDEEGDGGDDAASVGTRRTTRSVLPALKAHAVSLTAWTTWLTYVNASPTDAPWPLKDVYLLWRWLLARFATLPEIRPVALRWWFDTLADYPSQRALLESTDPAATALLRDDIYTAEGRAYRIYHPGMGRTEFYEQKGPAAYEVAPANVAKQYDILFNEGKPPVSIPEDTGPVVGFLVANKGALLFKSLLIEPGKKLGSGAACAGVSNLNNHLTRVRALNAAAAAADPALAALLLPDDPSYMPPPVGDKARLANTPTDIKSLTLIPLCLYLEFLTRLWDARRVGGKRWFLSAVEAARSNIKGVKR